MENNEIVDLWDVNEPLLLEQAYNEVLIPAFPSTDEREPLESLKARLENKPPPPQPKTHVLLWGGDWQQANEPRVNGVLIYEVYRRSNLGLITYMAVREELRGLGIGREIFRQAQRRFNRDQPGSCLLAEVHNPNMVIAEADTMNPMERLHFFGSLGGKLIPFQYVQPPLSHQGKKVSSFLLLAFPRREKLLNAKKLILFLEEFYEALFIDKPWKNSDFKDMVDELNQYNQCSAKTFAWQQLSLEISCPLLVDLER
jgi:GNAT superfamily N-acetyltransferase